MTWNILFHSGFLPEFEALESNIKVELLARLKVLEKLGPQLGRPNVDTLKGSAFNNMKELRFQLDGVWRFAFAFDPQRNAVVLYGADKEDEDSDLFYRELIKVADARFAAHIAGLKKPGKS